MGRGRLCRLQGPAVFDSGKRRTNHAVTPINASTTRKAMKNRAASGISEPNKLSNINALRFLCRSSLGENRPNG
jgi:hypothetical protein